MLFKLLKNRTFIVIFFSLFLLDCGYKFTTLKNIPIGIKKISIGTIGNKTNNIYIKGLFINELENQLSYIYNIELTSGVESDIIINGNILSMSTYKIHLEFFNGMKIDNTSLECLTVTIEIILKDQNGIAIWHIDRISEVYYYILNSYEEKENEHTRKKAIKYLTKNLCSSVLFRILWQN